jgi:hypothetical protein
MVGDRRHGTSLRLLMERPGNPQNMCPKVRYSAWRHCSVDTA